MIPAMFSALRPRLVDLSDRVRGSSRHVPELARDFAEYDDFVNGNVNWEDLPWPQGIFSSTSGTRQSWCRIELQLDNDDESLPFYASAAVYYSLKKP